MNNYTSKDVIDFCITNEFQKNNIKYAKNIIESTGLYDIETLVHIQGKQIKILQAKISKGNEWKAEFGVTFLSHIINKYNLDLNCKLIINMDDGVSYKEKFTRLAWARHKDSFHICIPDPLICGQLIYKGQINTILSQDIPFENKIDSAIFRGSDTGKLRDNLLNQRIEFCNNNLDKPGIDAKITTFSHFNKASLADYNINIDSIGCSRSSFEEQLKYKYIIYMIGNTVSSDRLIWNLASNSIVLQIKPRDKEDDYNWFHSFMVHNKILHNFPEDRFPYCFEHYQKREDLISIKEQQKYFASIILNPETQCEYYKAVLEKYNELYNA